MHAYLIMAHNNFDVLEKLILLLDDVRNDIYLHIDKKVKDFDFSYYQGLCKKSRIFFPDRRINVKWGGSSLVKAEMVLYKTAVCRKYDYYHLLSGSDLPLMTQDEIHSFFSNTNKEFIDVHSTYSNWDYQRLSRYHFPKSLHPRIVSILNKTQDILHIDRIKRYNMDFRRGYEWCSLSHDAVCFLVSNAKFIKKLCRATVCSDECYKQFLLWNSDFKNRIFIDENGATDDLREVDWLRRVKDSPHVFTIDDYVSLTQSHKMFARKFCSQTDPTIVNAIVEYVTQKNENRYRNSL